MDEREQCLEAVRDYVMAYETGGRSASEQQAREAAVTAFEQAVQNGILDFDPLVACYYGFKSGYDSRDAEVEALREQLREARSLSAGWAEIAVSSGTQENEDE